MEQAKHSSNKILDSIKKFTLTKTGQVDLIEFLDEVDHLTELNNTEEGGFRVVLADFDDEPGKKTYKEWEEEVCRILKSLGFVVGSWKGEIEPQMKRSLSCSYKKQNFHFIY